MINVSQPFLPPLESYQKEVEGIFSRHYLTNFGPLVLDLEEKLSRYLGVEHFFLVTNGTVAIQLAIKALDLKGEIITTPFSYVATTSSICWENCQPIFADISPKTLNIDPETIEPLITEKTSGILATHVFGYPCEYEKIEKIALKHKLKVIYDGAHAFGTKLNSKSSLDYGDVSTLSFHSTKLFHTIEGGAVISKDKAVHEKLRLLRNFGHTSPTTFGGLGINAKMNEFTSAMGLCNLKFIDQILEVRKNQWLFYKQNIHHPQMSYPIYDLEGISYNYAYFPIILESETQLLKLVDIMYKSGINPRRYFYPSLNTLSYVKYTFCPVSEDISKRILCLPLYHTLTKENQSLICSILNQFKSC